MSDNKLGNPLSSDQREKLLGWSSWTKEEDLLEGKQRKTLYQAGRYDDWFPNRVEVVREILEELILDLDQPDIDIAESIILILKNIDPEIEILTEGYRLGSLSPPETLAYAEELERRNSYKDACIVLSKLSKEFPENKTVTLARNRICKLMATTQSE